jgi:MATE family multidrug resistance protein
VIVLASLVMSVSTVVFNAVVGTGRTLVNLTIEVGCVLLYVLYCTVVIERMRAPLHIAWVSEFVYWTSLIIVSFWYLKSGRWMKAKTV